VDNLNNEAATSVKRECRNWLSSPSYDKVDLPNVNAGGMVALIALVEFIQSRPSGILDVKCGQLHFYSCISMHTNFEFFHRMAIGMLKILILVIMK